MKYQNIQKTVSVQSRIMVIALILLLVPINFFFYLKIYHEQQLDRSRQMFNQIQQVIEINEADLAAEREEFSKLCIQKADMLAYVVEHEPDVASSLEQIRELADVMDVDEIHFFTRSGEIYTGSHPEYYGFTVHTGEQIGFFAQMLENPDLKLCQDIMPNTALGIEMQYAAVWLKDQSGFVQIGMRPERLLSLMEEKSLQSIIGNIPFEATEYFHVVDLDQGTVTASSVPRVVGLDFSNEELRSLAEQSSGNILQLHQTYSGNRHCVYAQAYGKYLLIHTYATQHLLTGTIVSSLILLFSVLLATISVITFFIRYINRNVVKNLLTLNEKLNKIEQGDLQELNISTNILEFNTLIRYINQLLQSIRFDNKRMLDIVNSGQIPLGVFEYNAFYKKLFLNQWMRNILGVAEDPDVPFETQRDLILAKLGEIERNCVDPKQDVYRYDKDGETFFLKMKKDSDDQSVIYYLDDVSSWWKSLSVIREDSVKDVLTGLFNRRGAEEHIWKLFDTAGELKQAAVLLLDADRLKRINDLYGHVVGDEYLKAIASVLTALPGEHAIPARMGGDEFVVLLYGYDRREDLDRAIEALSAMRGTPFAPQRGEQLETLEFSLGCSYYPSEGQTFQDLVSLADAKMYQEKRERKGDADRGRT